MTITFKRSTPRTWLGNGMGYIPAKYTVMLDGTPIGCIKPSLIWGWTAFVGDNRFNRDKLRDAKDAVLNHFA